MSGDQGHAEIERAAQDIVREIRAHRRTTFVSSLPHDAVIQRVTEILRTQRAIG